MFAFGSSQMSLSNSEQKSRKDPCCLWWEGAKIVFPWANSRGCKSLTVLSRLPQVLSAQTSGGGQSWLPAHPRRTCLSQPQSFPFFPHLSIVRISREFSFMNSVSGSEVKLQQNCGEKKDSWRIAKQHFNQSFSTILCWGIWKQRLVQFSKTRVES